MSTVLGVVLLGVAFLLRPRLGRLSALAADRVRVEAVVAFLTRLEARAGLRAEMLERRPGQAAVTLTRADADAIDQELAAYRKRAVRELED